MMDRVIFEERYSRQHDLPGFGKDGQQRLATARIAVVGVGGLASPLLLALAGAGIGHFTLVDHDCVTLSNLNRQFLYTEQDLGKSKVIQAAEHLWQYRSDLSIATHRVRLTDGNAAAILAEHDLIAAAVDNRSARYVINRAACALGIPFADAAVSAYHGYIALFEPGRTACYECFQGPEQAAFSESSRPAPSVSGTIPAVLGAMQATLMVNWLLQQNQLPGGTLTYYNGRNHQTERMALQRQKKCKTCFSPD